MENKPRKRRRGRRPSALRSLSAALAPGQDLVLNLRALVPGELLEVGARPLVWACAGTLILSLLLGGGTRGGFLSDAILELAAIPALMIALSGLLDLRWEEIAHRHEVQWALALCAGMLALPLLQLIPLPPWIWSKLPGRDGVEGVFMVLGGSRPWLPISVAPSATWLAFLSLVPPAAAFLCVLQLGWRERRLLSLVVLAVGAFDGLIGLLQVAQGPSSPWRFFAITNDTEAVGFFANRNHFAALLYALLMFAAVWAVDLGFRVGSWSNRKSFDSVAILGLTASLMLFVGIIAGQAMARSRAGLILTIVALVATFASAFMDRRSAPGMTQTKLLIGATALAVLLAVQFALYRILDRFAVDPLADARIPFARNTFRAAIAFMPFGSGLGTFVPVYGMFERPQEVIANTFANHAHNDILELWLETGVLGAILLGCFLIWLLSRSARIWLHQSLGGREIDESLARAATVVIALVMAHSFVDYPLRTGAMMGIFAFACGLLIEPLGVRESTGTEHEHASDSPARASLRMSATAAPAGAQPPASAGTAAAPLSPAPVRQHGGRWGEDIQWPDEWRKGQNSAIRKDAWKRSQNPRDKGDETTGR